MTADAVAGALASFANVSLGGAVSIRGICTWPMGTDGIMIPRLAAADLSKTNGTTGCNIPFTAGPGVMARVSGVGVVCPKSAIGRWPVVGTPSDAAYSAAAPVTDVPPAAARR